MLFLSFHDVLHVDLGRAIEVTFSFLFRLKLISEPGTLLLKIQRRETSSERHNQKLLCIILNLIKLLSELSVETQLC